METQSNMLGCEIKTARIEKRLSQEALAEMAGVTPTHIKHIESGHRKPSIDVLFRLVKLLDISLDSYLFPRDDKKSGLLRKALHLLEKCDEKQIKVIIAALEAMVYET